MPKQTIADILDLIDPNRNGSNFINLLEYDSDESFSTLRTDSIALDSISDIEINSLGVINGLITIFLSDEAILNYWANNEKKAREAGFKKHEPTAREIVDGISEEN